MDHPGGDRVGHRADPAGAEVTPLPRRRPAKVARETATLDRLSGGRLTLGVGIASDGELAATGDEAQARVRGEMLDESLEVLRAAWSGEPVHHRGEHFLVDGIRFGPRPVQEPGVRKDVMIPRTADGHLAQPTAAVADAHRGGLVVIGWTFRRENTFLPVEFRVGTDPIAVGNLAGEITDFLRAGMDGFCTDNPAIGASVMAALSA